MAAPLSAAAEAIKAKGNKNMKKIAIINLKGGVGKTTTTANFAYNLGKEMKKVLVIDCDKQGNLSRIFNRQGKTLAEVLVGKYSAAEAVRQTGYSVDIIPADINLLSANQQLDRPDILGKALEPLETEYDYCLFDCAPNIDMITLNVLACADEVIIPVKLDGFTEDGIKDILEQVEGIKAINPGITFRGCLITISAGGVWIDELYKLLTERYKAFQTIIPYTKKVPESTVKGELLAKYSPRCGAAKAYKAFTTEYLEG